MQLVAFLSATIRKTQTLRIILILTIFFLLASVSRYQGSFEYSIDEDGQVQSIPSEASEHNVYYTHHIATYDPKDLKEWTEGDTRALRTPLGQRLVQSLTGDPFKTVSEAELNRIQFDSKLDDEKKKELARKPLKDDHFLTLTKRLRVYRALWHYLKRYYDKLEPQSGLGKGSSHSGIQEFRTRHFYDAPPIDIAPAIELFQRIEQASFPWILNRFETSFDLFEETTKTGGGGRGIVMSIGNYHTRFARTTIKTLRDVLGCRLPIEIYYMGEFDLAPDQRAWYESFEDVKTIDITKLVDNDLLRLGGWAAKPFIMLMTRFQEVILMDSDATFFQDPAVLFEDEGYKEVGTVYFYDRTVFPGGDQKRNWMKSFLPTMSNHPAKSRWFTKKGDHEMESGVVVIDKGRHFLGMLAICNINAYYEREEVTYVQTWGDKESFWVAMEMIQERYSFLRYGGGVLGNWGDMIPFWKENLPQEEIDRYNQAEKLTRVHPVMIEFPNDQSNREVNYNRVCGNLAHFDYRGQPIWWNSGVVVNKFMTKSPYLKYNAYMRDEDGEWDFFTNCMNPKYPGAIQELDWKLRQTAFEILKTDREVSLEMNNQGVKEVLTIPMLVKSDAPKGGRGNNQAV
ncbi:hypothetical protein BGZ83_010944 [Gryganskiella cystojenkinii]|nr:hypothetical protein BGZ83_010944 [Gryganskiella cystojenkinii]